MNIIEVIQILKSLWTRLFVSDQKKMKILIEKSFKVLEELCTKLFTSRKESTFVCFDIPGSKYMAIIKVTKNYVSEKKWRVVVGVMEESTNKNLEVYADKPMDDEEIIEYFRKSETKEEILTQIIELNEKAPDSFDF